MPIVKDFMTVAPATVTESMPVRELAQVLSEERLSGVPVVADDGLLIGVVTVSDLIYQKKNIHLPTVFTLFDSVITLGTPQDMNEQLHKMLGSTVGEIMSRDPMTVSEETTLEEVATIMSEENKHLLPVIREGELVGIIDRNDLLRAIVATSK